MPFSPVLSEAPTSTEVRSQLGEAADYMTGLLRTPEDQRGDTYSDDLRSARESIIEMDALLTATTDRVVPEPRGPQAAFTDPVGPDRRSVGQRVTDDEGLVDFIAANRQGAGHHEVTIRGDIHERRALIDSGTQTYTVTDAGAWLPLAQPLAPLPRQQRLFIRDVLTKITTGMHAVPYIQELNPAVTEAGATAVAEGTAKPEVEMDFVGLVAVISKIAAWVPVTDEIIADAPTLQGYINTRLAYMVALREEREILKGGGSSPNMKGIRDFTIQTQAATTGDFPATIGNAIGKVENVDLTADFVAANPLDFWQAAVTRHSTLFDNGYTPGAPAVLAGLTWGTTAVRTRSMEQGKALVGSSMGATILDREETTIRVGNQHSTFFTENKVAVLAEERVGLAVHRPDAFVEATIAF